MRKPPSLTPEQKAEVVKKLKEDAPKVIEMIGDKMAASKKPFWRKLVRFFRGDK